MPLRTPHEPIFKRPIVHGSPPLIGGVPITPAGVITLLGALDLGDIDLVSLVERDGRVFVHPGNVSDYLAATAARRQAAWSADDDASAAARKPSASDTSTGATPEDAAGGRMDAKERRRHNAAVQSRLSPLKKKLESTEKEIARLETAIKSVEDAMLDPAFYKQPDAVARVQSYDRDKTALDEAFMQWSETGDAIATIEKELL